ncbi:MAG: SUMF1/EgtB/PvdO family nonheme iron enzyme, partial [Acidobacteriota bacterium]
ITAWLDGARKREQALELVEEADARRPLLDDRARRVAQLREEARELLGSVAPHEPASRKQAGWEKEDQARELELALATAEVEQLQLLRSALSLAPDLDEARDRLADHHRTRLLEAESRRDAEEAARQEALLKAQASAQHQRWLDAEGALTLVSDPPGARVTLHVHVLHRRRLLRGPGRELGETPLHEVPLPRGSHALRLRLPGHEDTWQLVQVERGEHWTSTRPGDDEPHPVKLPPLGEIADDEVHVPAGWTWIGGDPLAPDGLARRRCWIDGFVVRRHPVTHEQHLAFLDELVRRGRGDEALAHAPQEIAAVVGHATKVALDRDDCGRFILPAASDGPTWRLDEPVVQVDWHAAAAHARWASERTGRPWRLLHDLEWEKAARGVDGRCFPWGDHLEPSWTVMLQSHAGRPQQASVSERPSDESPWGVRGMAGNVRDWCLNAYRREGPADELVSVDVDDEREDELRLVRGGSWNSNEAYCRLAGRFAIEPGSRFAAVGFRLARPFPER